MLLRFLTINTGKKKEDYIKRILNRVETLYNNSGPVEQVQQFIKTKSYASDSKIHKCYVSRFNTVDLGDRFYAKVDDHHRIMDWHSKMLYAILKLGVVDCYVYYIKRDYQDWIDFRRQLGVQLLKFSFE
jgi:hypothetical protein